ncbi:hypothetical protein LTR17_000718 [Elasticomyces elasticus]|nr:hypothetical protein LTR17_000718 [Elasticomyces elasticus]
MTFGTSIRFDHAFDPKLVLTADADASEADTCDLAFCAHDQEQEFDDSLDDVPPEAAQSTDRAKRLRDIQQQLGAVPEGCIPAGYLGLVQAHRLTMLWHQGCETDALTSRSNVTDSD